MSYRMGIGILQSLYGIAELHATALAGHSNSAGSLLLRCSRNYVSHALEDARTNKG